MSYSTSSRELLNLTQAMLLAAEAGEWEELGKLEVQRQLALKGLNATNLSPEEGGSVNIIAAHIREILSLNKRIIDLSEQGKAKLAQAMGGLHQGRKAVNAYHEIG